MYNFTGRVAIVTGGGNGLGRAISRRLAKEGAKVAIADINMEFAAETKKMIEDEGGEAITVECDVINAESVQAMVNKVVETFGKIDFLVNNAGIAIETRLGLRICDTPEDVWDKGINLNLKSVFLNTKYVVPHMIEKQYGRIVNISSLAAYFPAFSGSYGAAKAAVIALTKTIALQYADDNIRCNCICPGPMRTATGITAKQAPDPNAPRLRMVNRVADPSEMANVVCFLLSDEACFIDGTEVKVDGGSMAMSVKIPPRVKKEEE